MSKTKKVIVEVPDTSLAGDTVTEDNLTSEEQDALIALTDIEGGADAQWQVHRVQQIGINKAPGYLGTLSSSELRLDELQRRYGRGKYRIRGMRSNGQYLKGITVVIGDDPPEEKTKGGAVEKANTDILSRIEERDIRAQERRDKMMELVLPAAIAGLTTIMSAAMGRQQSNPIEMIAALKTLSPPQPDMTSLVVKLIEASRDGGGGKESWLDLAKDAARDLLPVVASKLNASQTPQTPQLPAPSQLVVPSTPASEGEQSMLKLIGWARATLQTLCSHAARNIDPELCAEMTLATVPEDIDLTKFAEHLNKSNWFEVLQQFNPGVAPYRGWFDQFRESLIAQYEDLEQESSIGDQVSRTPTNPVDEPPEVA